ncbi:LAFE_0B03400g1_1 [Lachancea fermentati]|uniref:LAFE_0B03400g1_1 n=1 Tax=Lachancea fermentati TaxID=4955 RepID=A0A1G4M7S7_LACFM|nr:LAFE_0B03400g1_1 [Lachancea fermentati]
MDDKAPSSSYYQQALEEYQELSKEEEEDDWDTRIDKTGCYVENMALQLCHADTNDWRQCLNEMALFKKCWESKGNRERVGTVDR